MSGGKLRIGKSKINSRFALSGATFLAQNPPLLLRVKRSAGRSRKASALFAHGSGALRHLRNVSDLRHLRVMPRRQ